MSKKLINTLTIVIDALKNDTIHYKWDEQQSCNCGVVAQACLSLNANSLADLMDPVLEDLREKKDADNQKVNLTWKNAVKYLCPITGLASYEIFNKLEEAGLSKADIVHLEFLENPAILAQSGIEKEIKVDKVVKSTKWVTKDVPETNVILKLFRNTKTIEEQVIEYDTITTEKYPDQYFAKRENLIKYLTAWVKIIRKDESEPFVYKTRREELEADLLIAVSEENYEAAADIRNRLAIVA